MLKKIIDGLLQAMVMAVLIPIAITMLVVCVTLQIVRGVSPYLAGMCLYHRDFKQSLIFAVAFALSAGVLELVDNFDPTQSSPSPRWEGTGPLQPPRALLGTLIQARPEELGGIQVLTDSLSGAGTCRTCGAALDASHPACSICETRQHEDCWKYVAHCTTFGCHGTPVRKA